MGSKMTDADLQEARLTLEDVEPCLADFEVDSVGHKALMRIIGRQRAILERAAAQRGCTVEELP